MADTEETFRRWGSRELAVEMLGLAGGTPSEDVDFVVQRMRQSASPGAIRQLDLMNLEIDVRDAVQAIRTPTLVMHRTGDMNVPVEGGSNGGTGLRFEPAVSRSTRPPAGSRRTLLSTSSSPGLTPSAARRPRPTARTS